MKTPDPRNLSRREFLTGAAVLAAGRPALSPRAGWIDAHSHVWSPDLVRWPRHPAPKLGNEPLSFTAEELMAQARPCGVARVVLIQRGFYHYDNGYMLEEMGRHPGLFSGVAMIDHDSPQARKEAARLAALGVRGFRIVPAGQPRTWLDSAGMAALWTHGAAHGLALCPLVDPDALPSIERMCRRHPDTTVVIDHICRIGVGGRFREEDIRALCELSRQPRVHVKISAFHALGQARPPYLDLAPLIRRVFEAYGPRRLMWGTDSPFQVIDGNTYAAALELVRDRLDFLKADDRDWMLRKTAETVFFQP